MEKNSKQIPCSSTPNAQMDFKRSKTAFGFGSEPFDPYNNPSSLCRVAHLIPDLMFSFTSSRILSFGNDRNGNSPGTQNRQ